MLPLGGARAITPTHLLYQRLDFHKIRPFHHPYLETCGEPGIFGVVSLSDRPKTLWRDLGCDRLTNTLFSPTPLIWNGHK
jgi:hypothetical protein